jgi:hypothetical protein
MAVMPVITYPSSCPAGDPAVTPCKARHTHTESKAHYEADVGNCWCAWWSTLYSLHWRARLAGAAILEGIQGRAAGGVALLAG